MGTHGYQGLVGRRKHSWRVFAPRHEPQHGQFGLSSQCVLHPFKCDFAPLHIIEKYNQRSLFGDCLQKPTESHKSFDLGGERNGLSRCVCTLFLIEKRIQFTRQGRSPPTDQTSLEMQQTPFIIEPAYSEKGRDHLSQGIQAIFARLVLAAQHFHAAAGMATLSKPFAECRFSGARMPRDNEG
jgi:hypothetical protein